MIFTELETIERIELSGPPFQNKMWRDILNLTLTKVQADFPFNLQVISPFGFEILNNLSYLNCPLRRFYIYIGIEAPEEFQSNTLANAVIKKFKQLLFENLKEHTPSFFNDLVISVENDVLLKLNPDHYICKKTDKLLDFQTRWISKRPLIDDYADYIIATLSGLEHTQGEGSEYLTNQMWRWRFYQLYIIQEALLGNKFPKSTSESKLFQALPGFLSNRIHFFYETDKMKKKPCIEELKIINNLIKPRISKFYKLTTRLNGAKFKSISVVPYHVYKEPLNITLGESFYKEAFDKLKQTYFNFG